MQVDETGISPWERVSRELNAEFGGQRLMHCHLLNGQRFSLAFDSVSACCSATHSKYTPTICDYAGSRIAAEDYVNGLARIIRENQGEDGPCTGCRFLVETSVPARFAAEFFSEISIHNFDGCNSACVYCWGSEGSLPVKYEATCDHEEFFGDLLSQRAIQPGATVVPWGGAEPTTLKTFEGTCDFFASNQIMQIINTSGIKFSPGIERALRARMASVQISADSGTEDVFRKVKRNRHYHEVWENIRRYAGTGGDVTVKYILLSLNSDPGEVEAFVERCCDAGVRTINISVDARAVFDRSGDVAPITEKELDAAASMFDLATRRGIRAIYGDIWTPEQRRAIALREEVVALRGEVAALIEREAALKQWVSAYEGSASWRLTRLLRVANGFVRRSGGASSRTSGP